MLISDAIHNMPVRERGVAATASAACRGLGVVNTHHLDGSRCDVRAEQEMYGGFQISKSPNGDIELLGRTC